MGRLLPRTAAALVLAALMLCSAGLAPGFQVERAPEWDALFDRTEGWTGADGIYSVPLSGRDFEGPSTERTLFVFSDTFVGPVDAEGRRLGGTALVNNTLALLAGTDPDPSRIRFHWGRDDGGNPAAVFVPRTPGSRAGDWYWRMDGAVVDGTLHLFALRMEEGDGGVFNFRIAGISLIRVPLAGTPRDQSLWDQRDAPLFLPATAEHGEIVFGAAIMENTERAGTPRPDGYLYVYGTRNDPLNKRLLAARVLPEDVSRFERWRFWDGTGWSPRMTDSAPITGRLSSEFSVTPLPDGRYLLVFQRDTLGRETAVRMGQSPAGPFGPPVSVWRCPEPDHDPDVYCYNAKAHPHLSDSRGLLISYNVNTLDFLDHFSAADIYRPRFIRLRLP